MLNILGLLIPKKYLFIAGGVLALVLSAFIWLQIHDHRVVANAVSKANVVASEQARQSDAEAADSRTQDENNVAEEKGIYNETIEAAPTGNLPPSTIALNCARLRRAGKDTTHIPACGGHK